MRRALFIAVLALLLADASGFSALLVPEPCAIGTTDSGPDGGCPAFCVRCSCACCAGAVVHKPPMTVTRVVSPPVFLHSAPFVLTTGISLDIFHVPKPLLT